MKLASGFTTGLVFGVGLAASGMTDTAKVIGFLDVFGNWDSDLLFVMGCAVLTAAIGFKVVLSKEKPLFASVFSIPSNTMIDTRLLSGAVLFGIGWGLYGYCPGPAIASLGYLSPVTLIFVVSMVAGMALTKRIL
ncbi:MAG: DUF6691 family protein [Pseudomonadales bacterium]